MSKEEIKMAEKRVRTLEYLRADLMTEATGGIVDVTNETKLEYAMALDQALILFKESIRKITKRS